MKIKKWIDNNLKWFVLFFACLAITTGSLVTYEHITKSEDDLHSFKPLHIPLGTIFLDMSNTTKVSYEPLFYRNGTIAGWLIDGNFSKISPFDMIFYIGFNSTHCYYNMRFP